MLREAAHEDEQALTEERSRHVRGVEPGAIGQSPMTFDRVGASARHDAEEVGNLCEGRRPLYCRKVQCVAAPRSSGATTCAHYLASIRCELRCHKTSSTIQSPLHRRAPGGKLHIIAKRVFASVFLREEMNSAHGPTRRLRTHSKIQCQRKTNRPIMYSTASARPKLTTAIEPEQLWPSQSQLQRRLRDALLGAGAIHLRAQARQRVQPRQPHACFESKEDGVRGEPRRTVPGATTRRETVKDGRSNEEAVRGGRRGCGALSEEAQSRYRTCLGGRLYRAPRLA